MYLLRAVLFLVFLTFIVNAYPESRVFLQRNDPIPLPSGWTRQNTLFQTQPRQVEAVFLLKQKNLDVLKKTLYTVSNPKNKRYGQHLSLEQVSQMVAPSQAVINDVIFWLKSNGIRDVFVTKSRDMLVAKMNTIQAGRIFQIKYFNYKHKDGRKGTYSPGPYSLPNHIAEHLDFVSGVVGFPDDPRIVAKRRLNAPQIGKEIDPDVIRTRYNATNVICTNANSSHAVAEFQAQYYSPADLESFWKQYVTFAPFRPVDKVVGTNSPKQPGIEASLDVQYIMGVAPNATTWFYSMKQFNFWADLVTWSALLNNETTLPYIHSISYGAQGGDPDSAYQNRLDVEFQKLGVRGVSILFASGDDGSGCEDGDYTGPEKACDCSFNPSFPATCPHVTSVGATRFIKGNTGAEGAVVIFKSGGGFSTDDFPVQSYQSDAVSAYLSSGVKMPEACSFNASGKATPDVSALGDVYFQVVNGGSTISVGGTSASSPSFSAIITLLNDLRFNNQKSSLGWLNPLVYQIASENPNAFFDVTNGDNIESGCCSSGALAGFECATGWDPVSGVGTPNYAELAKIVLTLP